jgi:hypothetical protein
VRQGAKQFPLKFGPEDWRTQKPSGSKTVIFLSGGWYEVISGGDSKDILEGQKYLGAGTRGTLRGKVITVNGVKFSADLMEEEDLSRLGEGWEGRKAQPKVIPVAKFMGKDLSERQREAARKLKAKFGRSQPWEMGMSWGRTRIDPKVGKAVVLPKQMKGRSFTEFEEKDARRVATELRKLKGQPVLLTGGGGTGYRFAFLESVKVGKATHAGHRDKKTDKWVVDKRTKQSRSVRVNLRAFPREALNDNLHMTPWLGSYRITALVGYGAKKIFPKGNPKGWKD